MSLEGLIDALQVWGKGDLTAVLQVGSRARGDQDDVSDIDIWCFTRIHIKTPVPKYVSLQPLDLRLIPIQQVMEHLSALKWRDNIFVAALPSSLVLHDPSGFAAAAVAQARRLLLTGPVALRECEHEQLDKRLERMREAIRKLYVRRQRSASVIAKLQREAHLYHLHATLLNDYSRLLTSWLFPVWVALPNIDDNPRGRELLEMRWAFMLAETDAAKIAATYELLRRVARMNQDALQQFRMRSSRKNVETRIS